LVETALGDSNEFEILSQEEVDDLKKQLHSLTARIEKTKQNLAIQSKYRDAAISMAKLYSPSEKKDGKHSNILHRKTDSVKEADLERIRSEERCEQLALELFKLEKMFMEPQNRLLKHTAGILQMTHKGPKKMPKGQGAQPGAVPGSPESMYTYHNARDSIEPAEEDLFDDRHLYLDADRLESFGENGREKRESIGPPPQAPPKSQAREQMQLITRTEQKLKDLNSMLRQIIVKANPGREDGVPHPPQVSVSNQDQSVESGDTLQSHLEYLENGLTAIDLEQNQSIEKQDEMVKELNEVSLRLAESERLHEESEKRHEESDAAMEETIEDMNREIRGILLPYDETRPELPELTGHGLQDQLLYFQESMGAIEIELSQGENGNKGFQDNIDQMETILMGLWDIIQTGYGEIRKREQERRLTRSANGLPEDDDDISSDEAGDLDEPFSLQAFSAKVQWLYAEATKLKDQKNVLQTQIKQQRELNNKSDATKDADMQQKAEELEKTKALLARTETDADNVRQQLNDVIQKLDEAHQHALVRDQEQSSGEAAAIKAVQAELASREETISQLEGQLQELKDDHSISGAEIQGRLSDAETKISALTSELEAATAEAAAASISLKQQELALDGKETEIDGMNMELARLQTEVTIARAELDGAYGSRAQRAAEVASNPAIQKEIDNLTRNNASLSAEIAALKASTTAAGQGSKASEEQMRTLKKELQETIEEYEVMTKASIEWEKEREKLEETIDKLREEREHLEAQLSDEKVRWLGMKSPGVDMGTTPAENTSTTVLKNEFKKMMRDTRADSAKALRVCYTAILRLSSH
jgi:hypothetical protein